MNKWRILAGAIVASFALSTLIVQGPDWFGAKPPGPAANTPANPPPWQVTVNPDGSSQALGFTLGTSTLADVRQRHGVDVQIAIVAAPGEDGTLEAYVDPAPAGLIAGKLVVTAALPAEALGTMRARSPKSQFMGSTTRKYALTAADEAQALNARITSLAFIPQASLDAEVVLARFGKPAERLRSNAHQEHFLYPAQGMDVIVDSEGKELIQYVAPRDFARLRQPLKAAP